MTVIIYADILFLLNMVSDFLILFLTGMFSGTGLKFSRAVISALIGAFIGTLLLCVDNVGIAAALITVTTPLLLCFAAFGKRSPPAFWNLVFYFYLSAVMLFGGVYAMSSVITLFFSNADLSGKALIAFLLIGAVTLIYLIFSSLTGRGLKRKTNEVKAELFDGVKSYSLNLLVDSGNMAKDPFSQKPVAIISAESLDRKLVEAVCDSDRENVEYNFIRPRVIPIKTVSGTALLYAFIPKKMYILSDGEKLTTDCIVAIDNRNNPFFGKDGIIPHGLVQML